MSLCLPKILFDEITKNSYSEELKSFKVMLILKRITMILFLSIFLLIFSTANVCAQTNVVVLETENEINNEYILSELSEFSDDFSEAKFNKDADYITLNKKWRIDIDSWGCDWYWKPVNISIKQTTKNLPDSENNDTLGDGSLDITMKHEPIAQDKQWCTDKGKILRHFSSGIIRSTKPILYGHFKARIKAASVMPGTSSAFWLYNDDDIGNDDKWWTEIDIVETGQGYGYFKGNPMVNPMAYSSHRFKHPTYPQHEVEINSNEEKPKEQQRYNEFQEQHNKMCKKIYSQNSINECNEHFDKGFFCRPLNGNQKRRCIRSKYECNEKEHQCPSEYQCSNNASSCMCKKCKSIFDSSLIENSEFNPSEEYHIYELDWNKEELVWYVDGEEKHREDNKWFHQPLYIAASLGVRPPLDEYPNICQHCQTTFPTTMKVDYIKTYKNDFVPNGGFEYYGDDLGQKCTPPYNNNKQCQNINQWTTETENGNYPKADYIIANQNKKTNPDQMTKQEKEERINIHSGQAALVHYCRNEAQCKNETTTNLNSNSNETYKVKTYTLIKDLPQGDYQFSAWVRANMKINQEPPSFPHAHIGVKINDQEPPDGWIIKLDQNNLTTENEKYQKFQSSENIKADKNSNKVEIFVESDSPYDTGVSIDDVELKLIKKN